MKSVQKISKNLKETRVIAREILSKILTKKKNNSGATVVGLSGNLGAGKTAFIKELGAHLGIKQKMTSPTFVIIKRYPIKHSTHSQLFHLDAYRLKDSKELARLGWAEIISDEKNLVFIEWPENVSEVMPKGAHTIDIFIDEKGARHFKLR